jgi:hypothetical protein
MKAARDNGVAVWNVNILLLRYDLHVRDATKPGK